MTKTFSGLVAGIAMLATLFALLPFISHAISRTESRTQAAQQRTAGTGQGNTGGTGGTNGGVSGGNGVTAETDSSNDVNVNPDTAQEFFDENILGSTDELTGTTTNDIYNGDTDELPSFGGDPDTGDTEEQVTQTDSENPGFGFFAIFNTIISRFRGN